MQLWCPHCLKELEHNDKNGLYFCPSNNTCEYEWSEGSLRPLNNFERLYKELLKAESELLKARKRVTALEESLSVLQGQIARSKTDLKINIPAAFKRKAPSLEN